MGLYEYRAMRAGGPAAEGVLEAKSRGDAFDQLTARGLTPVRIEEKGGGAEPVPRAPLLPSRRISHAERENFTRMLANLLAAGIPLSRALSLLHRESANPRATEVWKSVHGKVIDGMALADAMALHPKVFPGVYVAMVRAGETGGFLDLVLGQIADFQNRERDLRSKVMAALLYPVVLLTLALSVLVFLLVFFIPRFQTLFAGFGAELPLLTQVIVAASEAVRNYGALVALVAVGLFYALRNWLATGQGRRARETAVLRMPVLGPLTARFAMARFARMLGTLLNAGVPLIQGLNVARKSISNQILLDTMADAIERVRKGEPLSRSFADCKELFPGTVLEMIAVSEESGRLDAELIRLAETTEADLERGLRTAVALAEPLMLFLIAGFIGIIFIGMVIPIFTIQDYIK